MIINTYLREVEKHVFGLRNFQILQHVVTKVKDETYQFRSMVKIANKNIMSIFCKINVEDIEYMINFIIRNRQLVYRICIDLECPERDESHSRDSIETSIIEETSSLNEQSAISNSQSNLKIKPQ